MGAEAIKQACINANVKLSEIDLIINASVTCDEIVPDTSVKIHNLLKLENTTSFSVHATCMSSMCALNIANSILKSDPNIKTIAIVASEKSSLGINPTDPSTYTILGDIASAIIIKAESNTKSMILNTKFVTYSEYCNDIKLNIGNINYPTYNNDITNYYFKMNSFNLMNKVLKIVQEFGPRLFLSDYKYVVVHQPSKFGVKHLKDFFQDKMIESFNDVGNCVSASIPYNLHKLIHEKKIARGEKILLFGIGAGLNIGAINLIY